MKTKYRGHLILDFVLNRDRIFHGYPVGSGRFSGPTDNKCHGLGPKCRWYGILLAILNIPLRIVLWKILYWVSWLEYICWKVLATSLTLREPGMVGGMHINYSSFYILVSQFFVIKSIKFSTFNTILLWKPWLIRWFHSNDFRLCFE